MNKVLCLMNIFSENHETLKYRSEDSSPKHHGVKFTTQRANITSYLKTKVLCLVDKKLDLLSTIKDLHRLKQ